MTPMTEAEVFAFLKECGGRLMVTERNEVGAAALADKGLVTITEKTVHAGKLLGHKLVKTVREVHLAK